MSLKKYLRAFGCAGSLAVAGCIGKPYVPPASGPVATIYAQLHATQGQAILMLKPSPSEFTAGNGATLMVNTKDVAPKTTTVQANQIWGFNLKEFIGTSTGMATCGARARVYAQPGESYDVMAGDTPAQMVHTFLGYGPAWGSTGLPSCWVRVYKMTPGGWSPL